MSGLEIVVVPYYDDNFAYLVHDTGSKKTALIDCGEAEPVERALEKRGWDLHFVLPTHFHYDHAGEIETVKEKYPGVTVIKPAGESRLAMEGVDVGDGDTIDFGSSVITAVNLRAHTMYCTGYLIEGNFFVGDALFSAGCGRLFEGEPADLECAMDTISSMPGETKVYFGHEYTLSNIKFALSIEPNNSDLLAYQKSVSDLIQSGKYSTPTSVSFEKQINPFLRIDHPDVVLAVDPEDKLSRTERLGKLRSRKDNF